LSTIQGRDKPTHYSVNGIKHMLGSPLYAGKREYGGQIYEGEWEPIFDEETHLLIVAKLEARKQPGAPKPPVTVLSGIATCSVCGREVRADKYKGQPIYKCWEGHVRISREQADEVVGAYVVAMLEKPVFAKHLGPVDSDELADLLHEADRLRLRIQELSDALDEDALTMNQFVDLNSRTLRRLEDVETEMLKLSSDSPLHRFPLGTDQLSDAWLQASVKSKRDVITAVFDVLISPPPNRKRNVPAVDRMAVKMKAELLAAP